LGAFIAVGLPCVAHGWEHRWLKPHMEALSGTDPEMRLAALRDLNRYPILYGRAWGDACSILKRRGASRVSDDDKFDRAAMCEIERMVGLDPERICSSSAFIRAQPRIGASSFCQ
jgi:hypothetical protein